MAEPMLVEVIAYAPTAFYHCQHCEVAFREIGVTNNFHDEQVTSSLPGDLARDYQHVSEWVQEILRQHCDRVDIQVIDAASVEGFLKSLRYGVRRYPALIVDHQAKFQDGAFQDASQEIARRLGSLAPVSE